MQHRGVKNLRAVKSSNSGEDLALKELEGSTASGGDVGHLLSEASLLDGSDGVTSTDDGDGALGSALSKSLGNSVGSGSELVELEHTHGSVPDDGLAVSELLLDELGGLGTVVETHPSVGDGLYANSLGVGVGVELVGCIMHATRVQAGTISLDESLRITNDPVHTYFLLEAGENRLCRLSTDR
jgi:hypothetical protein